jgi:cytochrome c-type biogenesis protein
MDLLSQGLQGWLDQAADAASLSSILLSILLAYVGGVLSSLTPCIYPMIPITLSVVGGAEVHGKRAKKAVFLRGLAYVAGMAVVYSILGAIAGSSGRIFGSTTNTPAWYIGLGAIMSFAALMMMDVIRWDPQATINSLQRRLGFHQKPSTVRQETSMLGAFTLGLSSGFIAAPCTTPVLTAILTFIAQTKSVAFGWVLMLSFSLGLGTILLALALAAGLVKSMPKAGQWMNGIKLASGALLLAFAHYLFFKAGSVQ